jgi:hypothetical protein
MAPSSESRGGERTSPLMRQCAGGRLGRCWSSETATGAGGRQSPGMASRDGRVGTVGLSMCLS